MSRSRPFPPDAHLRQLKNQAKDLCRACRKGDPDAIRRIGQAHPSFAGLTPGLLPKNWSSRNGSLRVE
jgi:hypothetical protein